MNGNTLKKRVREVHELVDAARDAAERLRDDMQEWHDERSDNWQESERGEEYQEKVDQAGEAADTLQTALDELGELL